MLRALGVEALFFGHDHGNGGCCTTTTALQMCYGKHSGFGGYALAGERSVRGARVIDLRNSTLAATRRPFRIIRRGKRNPPC